MKFLAIAATLLMASSAFAISRGSSWGEIFAANNVSVGGVLSGVALDNTCLTQDSVKSIKPVAVCNQYGPVPGIEPGEAPNYGNGAPCLKPGTAHVSAPRTSNVPVCLRTEGSGEAYPECVKWGSKQVRVPDVVNVEVYDYHTELSFRKDYALPACAN